MSSREQRWVISADFSELTTHAKKAADAIKKMDDARNRASQNANKSIYNTQDRKWGDEEERQLSRVTAALELASEARKAHNGTLRDAIKKQREATIATTRAGTAHRNEASSVREHADAAQNLSAALGASAVASRQFTASSAATHRNNRATARGLREVSDAARGGGGSLSFLQRAFDDIIPVSRSWSLIMKMLPLTAVTSGVNTLIPTINGLGGAFVGLMGTITPVFGLLGSLPTVLTAAAGSIGGLISGLSGIVGAMGAYNKMQEAQTKASQKENKSNASSQRSQQRSIRNTTRSIARAQRDQVKAAEQVKEAQRGVAETARDNARAVVEAEQRIADAQADVARAQRGVNDARVQATRALRDYKLQLQGIAMDEESAALSLTQARAALAAVTADPGSTDLERRQADLAVRQAEQRMEEVRVANRDLEAEIKDAQAKGVEGSDAVVAAKQDEADANKQVIEAQEGLRRTYEDNEKSTRSAQKALQSAQESYADSGERIRDLKENLADLNLSLAETADAADPAAAQVNAFNDAMAKLPPSARKVVEELIAISKAWEDVTYRSQEAMSPGVLSFLRDLRQDILPEVADYLVLMAGGAGEFARQFGKLLSSDKILEQMRIMFADSYDFMVLMGESALNLTELFFGLGEAAEKSGLTQWVGRVIEGWTDGWKSAVDTPEGVENAAKGMQNAMHYAELWGDAIGSTWGFLKTFFRNFRPLGEWVLGNITDTMDAWNEWMDSPDGQEKVRTWRDLAMINLSGFADMIRTIADQGVKLFDGVDFQAFWDGLNGTEEGGGFINALGDLLGIVNEDMIVNLMTLGEGIMHVLQAIGEAGAMDMVINFVDVLGVLAGIAGDLARDFPILASAAGVFIAAFASKKMLVALGSLTGATPIVTAMTTAAMKGYTPGNGLGRASLKQYMGYGNFVPDQNTPDGQATFLNQQARREARQQTRARLFPMFGGGTTSSSTAGRTSGRAYSDEVWRNRARQHTAGFPANVTKDYAQGAYLQKYGQGHLVGASGAMLTDKQFREQQKRMGVLSQTTGRLRTGVMGITGAWKGVGGALKGAVGGIAGALGPLGLAVVAITGFTAALSAFDKYARSAIPDLEEVSSILDRVGTNKGAFDEIFPKQGWASPLKEIEGMDDAITTLAEKGNKLDLAFDKDNIFRTQETANLIGDVRELTKQFNKVDEAAQMDWSAYGDSVTELAKRMQDAGVSADNIAEAFPAAAKDARDALTDLAASGVEVGDISEAVADVLSGKVIDGLVNTTEGYMTAEQAAEKNATILKNGLVPALDDTAEKHKLVASEQEKAEKRSNDIKDAYRDLRDETDRLRDAQDELSGRYRDMEEAQDSYTSNMLESTEAVREIISTNSAALNEQKTGFDRSTQAGIDQAAMFRGLAEDAISSAEAIYRQTGSAEEADAALMEYREEIVKLLTDMGLSSDAANIMANNLGLIPRDVDIDFMLRQTGMSPEEIQILKDRLAEFNDEEFTAEVLVEALTDGFDATMEAITAAEYKVDLKIRTTGTGIANSKGEGGRRLTLPGGDWAEGGWTGPGSKYQPAGIVHADEYVVNKGSRRSIESNHPGALDYMNRTGRLPGYARGGRVGAVPGYATGGQVSSFNLFDAIGGQLTSVAQAAVATGSWMRSWGSGFMGWWNDLWQRLNALTVAQTMNMSTIVAASLTRISSATTTTMGTMVTGVAAFAGPMGIAWTRVMDSMKKPVIDGLNFLNNTLGTAVNKIGTFYGSKNSPFPVDVPGFSEGGWTGSGSKLQPAGIVHADEYVINKSARRNIERQAPGALDYMNNKGRFPGYANGGRVRPVPGAESGNYTGHSGIDYRAAIGTPVKAADDGVIAYTKRMNSSFGLHVVQRLARGLKAVYAHLSGFNVAAGESVRKGQVLGLTGNSGNSRGPHLHFEVTGGGFGAASNRNFTRQWLGQASSGELLSSMGANLLEQMPDLKALTDQFTSSVGGSPWGELVGKIISQVAGAVTSPLGSASGNFGSGTQRDNAFGIIDIAMRRGLGHRGALLGLMTAMQESSLRNLAGGDRDSVGLFQQRPSQGWGTVAQIMDPTYSANRFFDSLVKRKGWKTGPEWEDIQGVQISAFPTAYQKHKGAAQRFIEEWMAERGLGFARGGWTGPGSKYQPAGIVHADEYVINKASRRRLESTAPGLLDHMNSTGSIPGYAEGGKVGDPARWTTPRTLRNTKIFLSYLEKAQTLAQTKATSVPETKAQVQLLENLLAHEGLLWRRDADGWFGKADTIAWTEWQKRSGHTATGRLDTPSLTALMKKYKIPYDLTTPYVSGVAQPRPQDVLLHSLSTSNAQMAAFTDLLKKFKASGLTYLRDHLQSLGPNGIPDEYRDSENPITGIQLARNLSKDALSARKYNEALKTAAKFGDAPSASGMEAKMEQMLDLLGSGEDGPYGLQGIARELGVSLDTAATLYKKLNSNGSLKKLSASKLSRIRGDVVEFDNLFKFAKGGIVPGVGDRDSVLSLLTPGELVVPKDIVSSMYRPSTLAATTFADFSSRVTPRSEVGDDVRGAAHYTFETTIHNPVAEPSSASIQKRVKNIARLGLLG